MKKITNLLNENILIGPSSFGVIDRTPIKRLAEEGFKIINNPFGRKLTKTELIERLNDRVTGLIAGLESLTREILERSQLKVISRCGVGMSNIDLGAAKELGITVCSTPDAPTQAVAELTLGSLLCLIRQVPQMDRDLHDGKWNKRIGIELKGKTVVIVGLGRIGQRLAELLLPFKAKILAVDPYIKNENYDGENISLVSLEEALVQADIITLHASGQDCILGLKELNLVDKKFFLLNAGRGNLIDETALIKSIEKGQLKGAWLDTFEQEPYTGPLTRYPEVILTPHIGSYSAECRKEMESQAVDNLISGLRKNI